MEVAILDVLLSAHEEALIVEDENPVVCVDKNQVLLSSILFVRRQIHLCLLGKPRLSNQIDELAVDKGLAHELTSVRMLPYLYAEERPG